MFSVTRSSPMVSIVMPVYNGGDYFRLALNSALRQAYDNFEIVVVDDGSEDGGEAERIAAKGGKRVRYIRQENQGVAGALNRGLSEMRGDFFCWLSHDDLFVPHKTAMQAAYHARLGKSDAVLFSDYDLMDPAGKVYQRISADRERLMRAPMLALLSGSINGCTLFAPVEVMRAVGTFDPQYRYVQDYRFWNRLLRDYEFFHQPESLVHYRIHPEQGSNHANAVIEGDDLWVDMMRDRSESERVQMFGSSLRFFEHMARHLAGSPYRKAEAYARDRADWFRGHTPVSLVIPVAQGQEKQLRDILAWVDLIQDGNLEIVVAAQRGVEIGLSREDERIIVFADNDARQDDLLNIGLDVSSGSYLTFARPGLGRPNHAPSEIASDMMTEGAVAMVAGGNTHAITSLDIAMRSPGTEALRLENLMLHRSFVDGGYRVKGAGTSLEASSCFASLCRPELPIWRKRG
ncbi:MAG: glycosyltransferase [Rhizobiaceae bacterium]|nr:glycosyltransferase [Rhizobiaceae bacterium]